MRIILIAAIVLAALATGLVSASPVNSNVVEVVLTPENHSAIRDEVNETSVNVVLQGITNSDPSKPYYIYLDSPGGSVFAGRRLVSYLQSSDRQIICVAQTAISMAFVILEACPTRLMTNHGILMSHEIAGGAKGSLSDMKASLALTQKLADLYDGMIASRLGLTIDAYRAKIRPEFWMVGIQEGLDNKAVDAEVKVSCTKALEKQTEKLGEGDGAMKISKCPVA